MSRPRGRLTRAQGGRGQYGPRKEAGKPYVRASTRIASLYGHLGRSARLTAIPLNLRALARSLGYSYNTLGRITGRLAQGEAWAVQSKHFCVFLRPSTSARPHPQFFVISRHSLHRIGGEPGRQVRTRLRVKAPRAWRDLMRRYRNLAWGIFLRGKKEGDCKHKALPLGKQASDGTAGRPPPREINPAAWRRLKGLCFALASAFREHDSGPIIARPYVALFAFWKLQDEHSFEQILAALVHALGLVVLTGPHRSRDPAQWICAVAARHLDRDGFAPSQRRRFRASEARKPKAAFKEDNSRLDDMVDADWIEKSDPAFSPEYYAKLADHRAKDTAWQKYRLEQFRLGVYLPAMYPEDFAP